MKTLNQLQVLNKAPLTESEILELRGGYGVAFFDVTVHFETVKTTAGCNMAIQPDTCTVNQSCTPTYVVCYNGCNNKCKICIG